MTNQDFFDNKFSTLNALFQKKDEEEKQHDKVHRKMHSYISKTSNPYLKAHKNNQFASLIAFFLTMFSLVLFVLGFTLDIKALYLISFFIMSIAIMSFIFAKKQLNQLKRVDKTTFDLIDKVQDASNNNTQRKIIDFLSKIDKSFFDNIDLENLNEDEKLTLLAAIRAYRNNTYYAKPADEKIEELYTELELKQ